MLLLKTSHWAALGVLCLGSIMVMLDSSILNVAIPSLKQRLPASLDQVLWMVNAYTITWAVLLITAGRLGDVYGQRRLFAIGLVVFTAGSAACGVSQSAPQLIAARGLQGIGGALLSPQSLAILQCCFRAPAGRPLSASMPASSPLGRSLHNLWEAFSSPSLAGDRCSL